MKPLVSFQFIAFSISSISSLTFLMQITFFMLSMMSSSNEIAAIHESILGNSSVMNFLNSY